MNDKANGGVLAAALMLALDPRPPRNTRGESRARGVFDAPRGGSKRQRFNATFAEKLVRERDQRRATRKREKAARRANR
jgi:hypothetical protein